MAVIHRAIGMGSEKLLAHVLGTGTSRADLREAGAVEVWKDPADLSRNLGNSVLRHLLD